MNTTNASSTTLNGVIGTVSGTAIVNIDVPGVTVQSLTGGTVNADAGNTTVQSQSGGVLNASGSSPIVQTLSGGAVNLDGVSATIGTLSGGNISMENSSGVSVSSGSSSGSISGDGSLTKTGSGSLILSGANTYSGGTTVSGGSLVGFAGNETKPGSLQGGISVANNASVVFSQPLSGDVGFAGNFTGVVSGAGQLRFEQAGTVNITQAQTVTGGTFIGSGANVSLATGVGALSSSSALTVQGGVLNLGGNAQTVLSLALNGGAVDGGSLASTGALSLQAGTINASITSASALNKSGTGELVLGGANTFTGATTVSAGTLRLASAAALSPNSDVTVSGSSTIVDLGGLAANAKSITLSAGEINNGKLTANSYVLVGGTLNASLAGSGTLTKSGSGTATLGGDNVLFTGTASIAAGTILLANDDALSGATSVSVGSGATLDIGAASPELKVLNMNGGTLAASGGTGLLELTTVNVTAASTLNARLSADTVAINTSGTVTIGRENVLAEVSSITLDGSGTLNIGAFNQNLSAGSFTLASGTISGSGTLTAGTFNLASGTVGVNLAGNGAMNVTGAVALNGTYTGFTGNVSVKSGGNLTGSLTSLGGNLEVLGGGTAAFSVPGAVTFGGAISGAGIVNKSGSGALTLTGNSSGFTGDFNVQAGSVSGTPANLPAKLAVSSGATLSFSSGGTYAGVLSGAGTVNAANGTSLILSNFTGHTGTFNVAGASVDLAGAGTYAGQFSGAGTLTKSGSGALNLTGNNSGFTGTTAVNEGELSLGNVNALRGNVTVSNGATLNTTVNVNLGTTAQVTLNGGTIGGTAELAAGTFNVQSGTVSTFIAGNQLNKTGSGVLTVSTEDALAKVQTTTVGGNGTLDVGSNDQNLGLANSTLMVLEQGKVVSGSTRGASTITVDTFNAQEGEITVNLVTTLVKTGAGTVDLKGTSYVLRDNLVINDGGTLRLFEAPLGGNPLSFADPASTIGGTGNFSVVLLGEQQVAQRSIRTASIVPQSSGFNFNFNITGNLNVIIEGTGTTVLGGTNNSSGAVIVAGGTVVLETGSTSAIGGGGLNVTGGTLDIGSLNLDKPIVLDGGTITSSTGTGSITAPINFVSGTLNVGLSGDIQLVKDDPGVLVLSQVNTYTGGTIINAGTLVITQTGALPGFDQSGQVTINNGAALAVGNAVNDAAVATILATGNLKTGSSLGFDTTGGSRAYNTAITGNIGLVKVGSGELTLGAANIFTGSVGVQAGSLILGNANAIPSGRNVNLTGGTLDVGSFAPTLGAITAEAGSLVGSGTVTASSFTKTGTESFVIAGNLAGPATININGGKLQIGNGGATGSVGANIDTVAGASLVFNLAGSPTFNNVISGAGSVVQSGSGSVTLLGANTSFTGNVLVSSGTLALGNASALGSAAVTVANGGTLNVGSSINATTTASLILNGGTISGAGTLSAGSFELNSGTVLAVLAGNGAMAVNGSVNLNAANTRSGATTINSGGTLILGNNGALGSSAVTIANGGILSVGAGLTASSGAVTLNGGTISAVGNGSLSASSYTLNSGTISASLSGSGAMAVNGTVNLNAANTGFSGATTVNGSGTLNLGNNGALGSSAVTVASGGTLTVGSTINAATTGALTVNGGTISGPGTLSAGSFNFNNGSTVAAVLAGNGAMAINGSVNLVAANTYNGTATINSGATLSLGNAAALSAATVDIPSGGTLNVGSFSASLANLNLNGGTLSGTSAGSLSGTGTFTLTSGNVNVGLTGTTAVQVNGTIAFNRPNTYTGLTTVYSSGVLNLNVRNAITGAVTVNGGTLSVGANPQTLGAVIMTGGTINGASTITSTNGFTFNGGTVNAPIGGAVGVNITGGTVTLNGLNVYTGVTTISNGARLVGNVSSISGSSIVNNGTVEFLQSDNRLYGGAVSGSGSLVKSGIGTLTLFGTNTYSGGTLVSAGSLVGTTASLRGDITNNAAVSFNQANNGAFTNRMTGTGSLTKVGGGALTLSGSNAYTGATLVGGGSLFVEGDQAAATGAVTVAAGATLGGKGTVGGATTIAGIHRMGASQTGSAPGIQTFSQSLTYQAGAQAFWRLTDNTTNIGTPGNYTYDRTIVGSVLNVANAPSVTFNLSFNAPGSLVDWNNSFWSSERRGTSGWLVYDATTLNINGVPNLNDPTLWLDATSNGGKTLSSTRPDYTFVFFRDDARGDLYLNYIYSP